MDALKDSVVNNGLCRGGRRDTKRGLSASQHSKMCMQRL